MDIYLVKPAPRNDQESGQEWWVVDTRNTGEDVVIARFDDPDEAAHEAARLNSVGV